MELINIGEGQSLTNNYSWFKNEEVLYNFVLSLDEIASFLPDEISILGIGSGTGILEYLVKKHLETKYKKKVHLTLSDRYIKEIINDNDNDADIIQVDNKNLPFEDNRFDLIITRSVIHYEDSKKDVIKVLNEIHRVMKPGSYFINQALIFNDDREIKLLTDINNLLPKYLTLEKEGDVIDNHKEVFARVFSAKNQPAIPLTTVKKEFIKRYNLSDQTIPNKINRLISEATKDSSLQNIWVNGDDFGWSVYYVLLLCKK